MEEHIQERLARVQRQIAEACQESGRPVDSVTLVGVSKTHPASAVLEAYRAGLMDFGENRPEDAAPKMAEVGDQEPHATLRWHMIGHIQSRKARLVAAKFALVHSLDSVKLADKLSRLVSEQDAHQDVLLEMNVSGEDAKSGWDAVGWETSRTVLETLWEDIALVLQMPGIQVHGLMTMAPIVDDPEMARPTFRKLRTLRDALVERFPEQDWTSLSMGMTDDFRVAISEGATIVRIGRAIFGPRIVR